jgi:xylulokinase
MLAIDLGTSGAKAAVVGLDGRVLSTGRAAVETLLLPDGGAEQDPEAVWAAVLAACKQALSRGGAAGQVTGVAVCSQYSSIVPLSADGRPTMNMIVWLDKRGSREALRALPGGRSVVRDGPLRQLRWVQVHGIPPLPSGLDSLNHMRWVMLARPRVYERTRWFLEPMDFVTLRLTGRASASPCSAFMMLLVDNRDPGRPRYHPRLLRWSGIDPDKLPELLPVDALVGTLRPEVARELGLPGGVQVHAGLNDTQAGGMGAAAHAGSHAGLSIGTTSVLVTHVGFKRTDIRNSLVSMPAPVPGAYFVMAENGIGGRAVEHFLEKLVFHRDGYGDHALQDRFAALERAVGPVEPGSGGVLFLPWLSGSMSPAEDARVRGGFLNMSLETTREHLGRAVLEGVALNLRWLMGAVQRFIKRDISHLLFYGGGAVSDLWAQIIADVCQLPVHQLAEPRFSVCRGVGLLGFQRQGLLSYEDLEGLVPVRARREPRPELESRYLPLYRQFVRAFRANRRVFHALNQPPSTPGEPAEPAEPGET